MRIFLLFAVASLVFDAIALEYPIAKEIGLATFVMKDGAIQHRHTQGWANYKLKVPVDGKTNFRLASVSKQFTAAAAALLLHDERLKYDESIAAYLPQLKSLKSVSIRHLVHHLSGAKDYLSNICKYSLSDKTNRDVVEYASRTSPSFAPGSRFSYSNTGYALLASVVAAASEEPFPSFVQKKLFEPLGMKNSRVFHRKSIIPHRAIGYRKGYSEHDSHPCSPIFGDGGVYSSLDDLELWVRAIQQKRLPIGKWMNRIFDPVQTSSGKWISYGFGWRQELWEDHLRIYHGGSWLGYRTRISYFPESQAWIVVLSNHSDTDTEALTKFLYKHFLRKAI